jgi:hypothetical protein
VQDVAAEMGDAGEHLVLGGGDDQRDDGSGAGSKGLAAAARPRIFENVLRVFENAYA